MDVPLHTRQLQIFYDTHKIRSVSAGRRFGKTRMLLWDILTSAFGFPGRIDPISPQTVLATEPTLVMARQLLWRPLLALCDLPAIKPHVAAINRSEHRIDLRHGKPPIVIAGANEQDSLRGKRIYRYYGDEAQDMNPDALDTVILPAMADTAGSKALLTFTPKGSLSWTYALSQRQLTDPETYKHFHATTLDNPFVPRAEIERARLLLPPRLFRQEYLASFESFEGQIYSELDRARNRGERPDSFSMTLMGIDWGDKHPAFTVWGLSEGVWWFLEGWQGNTGNAIPEPIQHHHIVRLAAKWDVRGCYCDPSRPSSILTVRSLGREYRLPGLLKAIGGYNRIAEGISQVHAGIYQGRIKIPYGAIAATNDPGEVTPDTLYGYFEAYRYKTNRLGQVTEEPADGVFSHCLDSFRYIYSIPQGLPTDYRDSEPS